MLPIPGGEKVKLSDGWLWVDRNALNIDENVLKEFNLMWNFNWHCLMLRRPRLIILGSFILPIGIYWQGWEGRGLNLENEAQNVVIHFPLTWWGYSQIIFFWLVNFRVRLEIRFLVKSILVMVLAHIRWQIDHWSIRKVKIPEFSKGRYKLYPSLDPFFCLLGLYWNARPVAGAWRDAPS